MPAKPGIDHVVLCVRDLEAARDRFHRMGFTTTPPARHPFGTGNSLVQMGASFLELLTVVDPQRIPPHGQDSFSFGAHNAAFLEQGQGMSMLVISSADARADEARWRAAGLRTFSPVYFERQATQPDGSRSKVAFTIAFAIDAQMPQAVFFCCQQHAPDAFWQAEYQVHANGALDFDSVTLVADDPASHAGFLEILLQRTPQVFKTGALSVETGLGDLKVIAPAHAPPRWGRVRTRPVDHGAQFAAAAITVANLNTTARMLESGGVTVKAGQNRLTVPSTDCFGLALEFVQPST